MIHYVDLIELLHVHSRIIQQSGGSDGLRDLAMLESALAQPRMFIVWVRAHVQPLAG